MVLHYKRKKRDEYEENKKKERKDEYAANEDDFVLSIMTATLKIMKISHVFFILDIVMLIR